MQREGQTAGTAAPPQPPAAPANAQGPLAGLLGLIVIGAVALYGLGIIRVPGVTTTIGAPVVNTWTRSANYTTCTQWLNEMTSDQRRTMAGDLLPILRGTVDTAADDGAALVPSFADAISSTCQSAAIGDPSQYFVTPAAAVAFTNDGRFQP